MKLITLLLIAYLSGFLQISSVTYDTRIDYAVIIGSDDCFAGYQQNYGAFISCEYRPLPPMAPPGFTQSPQPSFDTRYHGEFEY